MLTQRQKNLSLKESARFGRIDRVRSLVADGADPRGGGCAALCEAAEHGHADIVRFLLSQSTPSGRGAALLCAAWQGHETCVGALIEHGNGPIHIGAGFIAAARGNHPRVIAILLPHVDDDDDELVQQAFSAAACTNSLEVLQQLRPKVNLHSVRTSLAKSKLMAINEYRGALQLMDKMLADESKAALETAVCVTSQHATRRRI